MSMYPHPAPFIKPLIRLISVTKRIWHAKVPSWFIPALALRLLLVAVCERANGNSLDDNNESETPLAFRAQGGCWKS
jgi:hypothetical protein